MPRPCDARIVEEQAVERRQRDRQYAELEPANQREAELRVRDRYPAADQLRHVASLRAEHAAASLAEELFAIVTAHELRVADVFRQRHLVPADGHAGKPANRDRQEIEDDRLVAAVVGEVLDPLI